MASVASRPMRRFRVACTAACASGPITPTTGVSTRCWSQGRHGGGRRVAGHQDQLHALPVEPPRDGERPAAQLVGLLLAVREEGRVTEVDEVLGGQRGEALVEDREPSDARVEDPDRLGGREGTAVR